MELFTAADLEFMQNELQADGIDTQGYVPVFLAETANGRRSSPFSTGTGRAVRWATTRRSDSVPPAASTRTITGTPMLVAA